MYFWRRLIDIVIEVDEEFCSTRSRTTTLSFLSSFLTLNKIWSKEVDCHYSEILSSKKVEGGFYYSQNSPENEQGVFNRRGVFIINTPVCRCLQAEATAS